MNISLRQLEAFLAVAQLSGFTRAAERLHLTQSAVSLLVRELESQLSVRLFDRTTRAVSLTAAGRELHPFVEKALLELQAGIDNTRNLLAKKRGRVVLAAPPLIASHLLPPVVSRFRESHPGIEVVLRDLLADEILVRVSRGEVDLGIGTFHRLEEGVVGQTLARDSLILVAPRGHALARKRKLRWRDLAGQALIALDRHSSLRHLVDRALEAAGCDSRPAYEVSFITTAIGMVESGLGVAVLPSYILLSTRHSRVETRLVGDPVVEREIAIVTRMGRSLSPAAEAFGEFARRHVRERLLVGRDSSRARRRTRLTAT
ncbi:MAG TPA: LysR family transcriptional regulator [Vicinamibacteria bacterium]